MEKLVFLNRFLKKSFLTSLKGKIQNHLNNFTKNCLGTTDCDFYIKSSWIVKLEKGNYSSSHVHGNSLISGVIYLQSDEQSSLLEFSKDPKYVNLFSSTLEPNIKEYNPFNSNVYSATTRIGSMYLFPSNLSHSVKPHQSNTTRYSLSFDCIAKGIFGENNGAQLIL